MALEGRSAGPLGLQSFCLLGFVFSALFSGVFGFIVSDGFAGFGEGLGNSVCVEQFVAVEFVDFFIWICLGLSSPCGQVMSVWVATEVDTFLTTLAKDW